MKDYANKTVWITGASSGIGKALAYEFAYNGAQVIASARREDKLKKLQTEITNIGGICHVIGMDVTKSDEISTAVDEIHNMFGSPDLLINNSGITQRSRVIETSTDVDRNIFEVNFFGAVHVTKAILPGMLERGYGQIAVTSSIVGKFGFPLRSAYSASKHALHGFFETLRLENPNIKVSVIVPGRINTNISYHALNQAGEEHGKQDEGQASGMPVSKAAKKIYKGLLNSKKEILVGGKELIMVYLRRYIPWLFYYLAKRVKPT